MLGLTNFLSGFTFVFLLVSLGDRKLKYNLHLLPTTAVFGGT